jgi:hypothetical protein
MARSGGAEPRQDSGPKPQEADCPVPAQEVQLRYRECHRAILAFRVTAQVPRSALLAEPAAALRRVEQSVRGLSTEACFARVPRQAALGRAVAQPEGPLVSAHPVFAEAGSAASARLWPVAKPSVAH